MVLLSRIFYVVTILATTVYLSLKGAAFYDTPLEERFYHEQYDLLKASGLWGHGMGIVGTALIAFGVFIYIGAKKYHWFARWVRLRYLLEFHIFLCTLGPILVVFHTTFKFGGLVSIAFWSMVIVVLSGVVGRFLYIRLPRDWQGRELTMEGAKVQLAALEAETEMSPEKEKELKTLRHQIKGLERNSTYFKYWHIAHRPFALIMLVIVIVHIVMTLLFGFNFS